MISERLGRWDGLAPRLVAEPRVSRTSAAGHGRPKAYSVQRVHVAAAAGGRPRVQDAVGRGPPSCSHQAAVIWIERPVDSALLANAHHLARPTGARVRDGEEIGRGA